MKKSGVVQLNVRVPEFIAERLRTLAALSGETQAELVILALQDYLDKHNDLIRNFLALQQRFAGGRAHSAVKDTGSPSQVAGQTAQAEEAQGSVPAESAQVPQDSEQGQTSQQEEAAGTENTVQEEEDKPGPSVEDLRARARELKAQGLNQSQIAREIGRSEASVRRYLKAEA